jgi:hypothetical protein
MLYDVSQYTWVCDRVSGMVGSGVLFAHANAASPMAASIGGDGRRPCREWAARASSQSPAVAARSVCSRDRGHQAASPLAECRDCCRGAGRRSVGSRVPRFGSESVCVEAGADNTAFRCGVYVVQNSEGAAMTVSPGPKTILVTTLACIIGLMALTLVLAEPRPTHQLPGQPRQAQPCPAGCDCRGGAKGEERFSPIGQHEWFNGQCWTTTPQPPRDMPNKPPPNPELPRPTLRP